MIISEQTALFLIPFGISLGNNAYDLLNGTNLLLLPIIFVVIYEVYSSRAQGLDEGSPASLALRRIEVRLLAMFFVLLVCVMPLSGQPTYQFAAFSCSGNNSLFKGAMTVDDVKPADTDPLYGKKNTSIAFGLVNNFATALSNAMTAQIPCGGAVDVSQIQKFADHTMPMDDQLKSNIVHFNNQCYTKAAARVTQTLESRDQQLMFTPESEELTDIGRKQYWQFNSPQMRRVYDGTHIVGTTASPLTMSLPSNWGARSSDADASVGTILCSEAASYIYGRTLEDIPNSWQALDTTYCSQNGNSCTGGKPDITGDFQSFFNLYSSVTKDDMNKELVQIGFVNTIDRNENPDRTTPNQLGENNSLWAFQYVDSLASVASVSASGGSDDSGLFKAAQEAILFFGSGKAAWTESNKAFAAVYMIPLTVSVIQSALLAFHPLVIVLSGYKPKVAYQLILTYFTVTMVPFFLNVGVYIATLMVSYRSQPMFSEGYFSSAVIGYIFVYGTPALWVVLMQSLGSAAGSAMSQGMAGAMSAGQEAGNMGNKMMDQAAGKTGAASWKATGEGYNKASKKVNDWFNDR